MTPWKYDAHSAASPVCCDSLSFLIRNIQVASINTGEIVFKAAIGGFLDISWKPTEVSAQSITCDSVVLGFFSWWCSTWCRRCLFSFIFTLSGHHTAADPCNYPQPQAELKQHWNVNHIMSCSLEKKWFQSENTRFLRYNRHNDSSWEKEAMPCWPFIYLFIW